MKSKIVFKSVLLLFIFLILFGCITVTIESRKHPEYNELLGKTLVLIDVPDTVLWVFPDRLDDHYVEDKDHKQLGSKEFVGVTLGEYLSVELEKKLVETGIDVKTVVLTGLELEDEIESIIAGFEPKVVMFIQLTEIMAQTDNLRLTYYYSSGVFDIKLLDVPLDRDVWRAKTNRVLIGINSIDQTIDQLFIAMQNDGLIATFTPVE